MNFASGKANWAIVVFCFWSSSVFAQYQEPKWEIGASLGTLIYQGDLSAARLGNYKELRPMAAVHVSRKFDQYFALRAKLTVGALRANESLYNDPAYMQQRNLRFKTPVVELLGMAVWTPAGQNTGSRFSYYFMAGAGATYLNIQRDWSDFDYTAFGPRSEARLGLGRDTAHSTPHIMALLPIGGGFRYAITPRISVNTELLYRITPSDYLDGFKYTGNPDKRDSYYGISLGVTFKIGKDPYSCPKP